MLIVCIFPYLLNICRKFELFISQSIATCLRWGGYCCMGFVANFISFPAVHDFENRLRFSQSYREFKGKNFLRHSVVTRKTSRTNDILHNSLFYRRWTRLFAVTFASCNLVFAVSNVDTITTVSMMIRLQLCSCDELSLADFTFPFCCVRLLCLMRSIWQSLTAVVLVSAAD